MINIMSLLYYNNRLLLIKSKQLLIKKNDYFSFVLVYNIKLTNFMHLFKMYYLLYKKNLVDLIEINPYYICLILFLTTILFLDPKYPLSLIKYYVK